MRWEWLIFAMSAQTAVSWPFLAEAKRKDSLWYLNEVGEATFEVDYFALRAKEGRIQDLEGLKNLPLVEPSHPHAQEWKVRQDALNRFLQAIKPWKCKHILDLGCGNGWMSRRVAEATSGQVLGMDLNEQELQDAQMAFTQTTNLEFVYADIFSAQIPPQSFDLIFLAGSVQYFSDLPQLLNRLLQLSQPNGRIVIFDSHFYPEKEQKEAEIRSRSYYQNLGFPDFADNYFHHSWNDLKSFNYKVLYEPLSLKNKIVRLTKLKSISPFPMIIISPTND